MQGLSKGTLIRGIDNEYRKGKVNCAAAVFPSLQKDVESFISSLTTPAENYLLMLKDVFTAKDQSTQLQTLRKIGVQMGQNRSVKLQWEFAVGILVQMLLSPSSYIIHTQLVPTLQSLSQVLTGDERQLGSVATLITTHLDAFLSTIQKSGENAHQLYILHYLLDLDIAAVWFVSKQERFLTLLSQLVRGLKENSEKLRTLETAGTATMKEHIKMCETTLKALLVTQTKPRFQTLFSAELAKVLTGTASSASLQLFRDMIHGILQVLHCGHSGRDCLGPAGLVLAAFLSVSALGPSGETSERNRADLQAIILHSFFSDSHSSHVPRQAMQNFEDILLHTNEDKSNSLATHFNSFPLLYSRLSIIRGIIIETPTAVLTMPLIERHPGDSNNRTLLWDFIRPLVTRWCKMEDLDHVTRRLAFNTLSALVKIIRTIIKDWAQTVTVPSERSPQTPFLIPLDRFLEPFRESVLDVVWANWSISDDGVVDEVNKLFGFVLDLNDSLHRVLPQEEHRKFLQTITNRVLLLDHHIKLKYSALLLLLNRISAREIVAMRSGFFREMLQPMNEYPVRSAIGQLLNAFLRQLKREAQSAYGQDKDTVAAECRKVYVRPLVEVLCAADPLLAQGVILHILASVLKIFPNDFDYLLSSLQAYRAATASLQLRGLISFFKVGRQSGLIDGSGLRDALGNSGTEVLQSAFTHIDPLLRADALELLAMGKKTTETLTPFDFSLMRYFLIYNLKCDNGSLRQTMCAQLPRFLSRIRDSPRLSTKRIRQTEEDIKKFEQDASAFLRWLNDILIFAVYPGAPFERKLPALALYHVFLDSCITPSESLPIPLSERLNVTLFSPTATYSLLLNLWDNVDRPRQLAYDALSRFPSPLPGFETPESISVLTQWAMKLVASPRVREADTGALLLRLVLAKYVAPKSWVISLDDSGRISCTTSPVDTSSTKSATWHFIEQTLKLLEQHLSVASSDLLTAAQTHPMHGVLLAVRYMFLEINFKSFREPTERKTWRELLQRLLQQCHRVTEIVLGIVTRDAPEATEAVENSNEYGDSDEGDYIAPESQLLAVCAWLSIKEIALILGAISKSVPFPLAGEEQPLLTESDIRAAGDRFLHILLYTRHKGALEKSYTGFQFLCEQLLSSSNPTLLEMPVIWAKRLLSSLEEVESVTRRSGGLPFCFSAILQAEANSLSKTKSGLKVLLPLVLDTLFRLAEARENTDGSAIRVTSQVHSLNILRKLFRDSALSAELSPLVGRALILSIEGYNSPDWSIRNSATMTFSVIVEKVITHKTSRDEHSRKNTTTFGQFFGRFPQLYAFLLQQLTLSREQETTASKFSRIYPLLMLLSKLLPSPLKSGQHEVLSTSAFIPLVGDCVGHPNYKIREMAARALVPLVDPERIGPMLADIFEHVSVHSKPPVKHNFLHGYLLQIRQLLHTYSISTNEVFLANINLLQDLVKQIRCPPIESVLWDILSMACTHNDSFRHSTQTAAWDFLQSSKSSLHHLPMTTTVRVKAAKLCLSSLSLARTAEKETAERLDLLLNDRDYEIRLATLKYIVEHYQQLTDYAAESTEGVLKSMLAREKHYACLRYVLRAYRYLAFGNDDLHLERITQKTEVADLWHQLIQWSSSNHHSSVREEAVRVMGAQLAHHISALQSKNPQTVSMFKQWREIVQAYSQPDQSYSLRMAAVDSIRLTRICQFKMEDKEESIALSVWFLVLELLQDDDQDVRTSMALLVSNSCASASDVPGSLQHEMIVPKALETSFAYLTANYHASPAYWDRLSTLLLRSTDVAGLEEQGPSKLFEKEDDNWYVEELLISQLAGRHILRSLASLPGDSAQRLVLIQKTCVEKMNLLLARLRESTKGIFSDSILSSMVVTSQKEVFLPLCRILLALTVCVTLQSPLQEVQEVLSSLALFRPLHPLVDGMLQRLIRKDEASTTLLIDFMLSPADPEK